MSIIDYAASGNNSVNGINIATGCNPANVDNALRALTDDLGSALRTGYFATVLPSTKSAGYAVLTTDRGKLFNCTAALTLTLPAAATAEAGFLFYVKANGGAVIIDPNGAELIDGATTVTLTNGSCAFVTCTGTAWVTAFVASDVAAAIVAATAKASPIDADSIGIVDSAAANVLKETTIGELKAVILAGTPTLSTIEALSLVQGDTLYATAADTIVRLPKGTANQRLSMNAGATAPEWQTLAGPDYGAGNAALAYNGIGTYVMGYFSGTGITENTTTAGSNIEPGGIYSTTSGIADDASAAAGLGITKGGAALSGTWRVMGRVNIAGTYSRLTLFLRIS